MSHRPSSAPQRPTSPSQLVVEVSQAHRVELKQAGHSYVAQSLNDNALTIDMSRLNNVTVDQSTGIATIGGGSKLGDVALSLWEQGQRQLGHGTCPFVGAGGHMVSGGFGLAGRELGLSIDRIIGHEVVLANGTIMQTSNTSNTDLFWALRGGGGSFGASKSPRSLTCAGVVTQYIVQTAQAGPSYTTFEYDFDYDISSAAAALKAFQSWSLTSAPSNITIEIDGFAGSSRGRVGFHFSGMCATDADECSALLQPLLSQLGQTTSSSPSPPGVTTDWEQALAKLAGGQALNTTGASDYSDNFFEASVQTPASAPLTDDAINSFVTYLANTGFDNRDQSWFVQVELYGGANSAIAAVPVDDTAFVARDTLFTLQLYSSKGDNTQNWPSSGQSFVSGMRDSVVNPMGSSWNWATYANYVDTILPTDQYLQRTYGKHLQRLVAIKNAYDPSNLIQFPTSIPLSL